MNFHIRYDEFREKMLKDWTRLPIRVRQAFWQDTKYGSTIPSEEVLNLIARSLHQLELQDKAAECLARSQCPTSVEESHSPEHSASELSSGTTDGSSES